VVFQAGLQPEWVILAVCAREALSIAAEVSFSLPTYFISKNGLFTLRHTRDGQLSNECCKLFL
jgi:hypothetical protein